jgi:hypothetical protein
MSSVINGWYYLPSEHQLFLKHLGLEMKAILAQGTADADKATMALEQHKLDMCRRIDNEIE